jgi:multidrug efflux pump subunit AcrB
MRIWLKPDRLAANNLSPQEVLGAIKDHNLEAAPDVLDREVRKLMNISLNIKVN